MAKGATLLTIQGIIANGASLIYFVFATRILPNRALFGNASMLAITNNFLIIVGTLLLSAAAQKYVAENIGRRNYASAKAAFLKALMIGGVTSLLTCLALFIAAEPIAIHLLRDESNIYLIRLASLDLLLLCLYNLLWGGLLGIEAYKGLAFAGSISTALRGVLPVLFLFRNMMVEGILFGWILGDAVGVGLLSMLGLKLFSGFGLGKFESMELLRYSIPLCGSYICSYLTANMDRYLILIFFGGGSLGLDRWALYAPAMTAVNIVGLVLIAIQGTLFSNLSRLYGEENLTGINKTNYYASKFIHLVYSPIAIGLASLAQPIMLLFAGEKYVEGALALAIIAFSSALTMGLITLFNSYLMSIGWTKNILMANILALLVDSAIIISLIRMLDIVAAAIARGALLLTQLLYFMWILSRNNMLIADWIGIGKTLVAALTMLPILYIIQLIYFSQIMLPFYVLIGGVIYFMGLKLFKVLNKGDIEFLKALIPKKIVFIAGLLDKLL